MLRNKKMKSYHLILIVLLVSCKSSCLNLGNEININSEKKIFLPTLNFSKYEKVKIKSVEYIIATNDLNKIIYISSKDEKFKTSNLNINSFLKDIPNYKDSLKFDSSWGVHYIEINKDWYAGFNGKEKPSKDSNIEWFFKYNFPNKYEVPESLFKKFKVKK